MFQRETSETYTCPTCGRELKPDNDKLRCDEHGIFFVYGPNLVVRAQESDERAPRVVLPWEQNSTTWA